MDIQHFKDKLETELLQVEGELESTGKLVNPETGDWEVSSPDMDTMPAAAEKTEAGDRMEEFEANRGITENLEVRWKEIKHALEKIDRGTYGVCEVSGEPIEQERLEANPAARTCMRHM